jgi:hypothetical protein
MRERRRCVRQALVGSLRTLFPHRASGGSLERSAHNVRGASGSLRRTPADLPIALAAHHAPPRPA